jgi:hypothetical protein
MENPQPPGEAVTHPQNSELPPQLDLNEIGDPPTGPIPVVGGTVALEGVVRSPGMPPVNQRPRPTPIGVPSLGPSSPSTMEASVRSSEPATIRRKPFGSFVARALPRLKWLGTVVNPPRVLFGLSAAIATWYFLRALTEIRTDTKWIYYGWTCRGWLPLSLTIALFVLAAGSVLGVKVWTAQRWWVSRVRRRLSVTQSSA